MKFAKLVNDSLVNCPKSGESNYDHHVHSNLVKFYTDHPEAASFDGWFEFIETEKPVDGTYVSYYEIQNGKIYKLWKKIPDPKPEIDYVHVIEQTAANVEFIGIMTDIPTVDPFDFDKEV